MIYIIIIAAGSHIVDPALPYIWRSGFFRRQCGKRITGMLLVPLPFDSPCRILLRKKED
jgi:hypothetical protein